MLRGAAEREFLCRAILERTLGNVNRLAQLCESLSRTVHKFCDHIQVEKARCHAGILDGNVQRVRGVGDSCDSRDRRYDGQQLCAFNGKVVANYFSHGIRESLVLFVEFVAFVAVLVQYVIGQVRRGDGIYPALRRPLEIAAGNDVIVGEQGRVTGLILGDGRQVSFVGAHQRIGPAGNADKTVIPLGNAEAKRMRIDITHAA